MTAINSLIGIWQPAYAEFDGEEAPKMMLDKMELELTAGDYFVRFGGVTGDQGTYTLTAAGLTLHGMNGPNAGRIIPCIAKFKGELLSICYGLDGTLPSGYHTRAGTQRYLANYTRK